ncbi:Imm10 family immunity protein [Streptomyces turgidiscabies]|nr:MULTISPECIES: Imm10 family immunity protein [Streptomyces]MDX3493187.1 Imm10 family immunity protein [Streptomyces turgidiscabies]
MLNSPEWAIRVITAEENLADSCFVVGIAEDSNGEGSYFIFQCGLRGPSEQNRALGLDSYCILDQAGGVHFGGMEEVRMDPGKGLYLRFNEAAAESLDLVSNEILLGFSSNVDVELLGSSLRRVFFYGNPENFPQVVGF